MSENLGSVRADWRAAVVERTPNMRGEPGHGEESRRAGWQLRGTAVFRHEGGPARLDYEIEGDAR